MATRAKCTVKFAGASAVLYDRRGRSLNAINYPRGHTLTAKQKAAAKRKLMRGCAELSRRR